MPVTVFVLIVLAAGALGADAVRGVQTAALTALDDLIPPTGPDEQPTPLPSVARPACARDPAAVPPPPTRDGRTPNYLHTCGNRIYDAFGQPVRLTGVSWSGLENGDLAAMGLARRNWQSILDEVALLGYNAIRLPFSNAVLRPDFYPTGADPALNPDLVGRTGLEVLDRLIAGARARGLRVVLDRHRTAPFATSPLWYDAAVSESTWIADWQMLARRYLGDDTVVGVDLHNEPGFDATWGWGPAATDWRRAAERAGNAVLAVNPYLLIFVEGVTRHGDDWYWQGGYLDEAGRSPVRLAVPNRLVYSPHDYGPDVYPQVWFSAPDFPGNLLPLWQRHWAYLHDQQIAPIVVGEFGGHSVGDDPAGRWQRTLLQFVERRQLSFFVWSLNPTSADTGGIFAADWQTVEPAKQAAYAALLAPSIESGAAAALGAPRGRLRIDYQPIAVDDWTRRLDFSLDLVNEGEQPVPLAGLEVRYWLRTGGLSPDVQRLSLEAGADFPWPIEGWLEQARLAHADAAIVIRFGIQAPSLAAGQRAGPIRIRLGRTDRGRYLQTNDYSFSPTEQRGWLRVTVSRGHDRIWGVVPPA